MSAYRSIEQSAAKWLVRRDQPDWSPVHQADLDAWLEESAAHKAAFWRLEHGWEATMRLAALRHESTAQTQNWRLRARAFGLVAASLIAVVFTVIVIGRLGSQPGADVQPIQLTTQLGQHSQTRLADGSLIAVNTASSVRAAVVKRSRQVWIDQGEAFFEVAHDAKHPFVVIAGNRKVTVLGTRFSVRRDGDRVTVAVVEGRVRVESSLPDKMGAAAILTAGDVAISQGPSTLLADRSPKQVDDALSWRRGMLTFDRVTIADAAEEFNRYNRRQIHVADPAAGAIRIGGTFEATNVEAFARLLQSAFGLQIVDEEKVTIVKSYAPGEGRGGVGPVSGLHLVPGGRGSSSYLSSSALSSR